LLVDAFLVPLISIVVMELGDKTQLAIVALSATNRKPLMIFLGAMAAFSLVNSLGVLVGEGLLQIVPVAVLSKISGLIFLLMGSFLIVKRTDTDRPNRRMWGGILSTAFISTFLAELGDKTQIATITLAAKYDAPAEVILGVLSALALVTGIGVALGAKFSDRISQNRMRIVAGALLIVIGALTLIGIL